MLLALALSLPAQVQVQDTVVTAPRAEETATTTAAKRTVVSGEELEETGEDEISDLDHDGDPETDTFFSFSWLNIDGNWPNRPQPVTLLIFGFETTASFSQTTTINFDAGVQTMLFVGISVDYFFQPRAR